jgi:hypothetical protein
MYGTNNINTFLTSEDQPINGINEVIICIVRNCTRHINTVSCRESQFVTLQQVVYVD